MGAGTRSFTLAPKQFTKHNPHFPLAHCRTNRARPPCPLGISRRLHQTMIDRLSDLLGTFEEEIDVEFVVRLEPLLGRLGLE